MLIENAVCKHAPVEWFYPQKGLPALGKQLCEVCPVQEVCLEFAMENLINFGVWGGLSERERYVKRRDEISEGTSDESGSTECGGCVS